ncbi:MAG TPA: GcrA family cell cycle regulator [Roseiarcus sp.]|nr:GcrA family cell cycle regulator [Roseiarcus sp.]
MAKVARPAKRPTRIGGVSSRREAATHLGQERRNDSVMLAASVQVKFMELRPSMCRWPIGDPRHSETFRFCGSACPSEASYCKKHTAIAHTSNRPRTQRTTQFQMRPR